MQQMLFERAEREKQALEVLSSHGNLVKRPFALHGKNGVIGFKEPEWATFLDQMR